MMAAISGWVREIAVVVLLGWVLEMLVPRQDFRRYVRLVIGLLVLVAVIRPALVLLGHARAPTFPDTADGQVATLIAQGKALEAQDQGASLALYAQKVGEEAAAIADTVPGVGGASGTAEVDTDPTSPSYGDIRSVDVTVRPTGAAIEVGSDGSRPPPARLEAAVQAAVAGGLQVAPSAVGVTVQEGG